MNVQGYLNEDGLVMLALCSSFGINNLGRDVSLEPFTPTEWNQLERKLAWCSLKNPSSLNGLSVEQLTKYLSIVPQEAERIVQLLQRAGRLALGLEYLFSQGIWAVSRRDNLYPKRLRETLKHHAPTVLFGAGQPSLLDKTGIAVVGSRNIDQPGAAFARTVGQRIAEANLTVVSGGARGSDRIAMDGAMDAEGTAIGILADSLEATIRKSDVREMLLGERLLLLTPYSPTAGFSVGAAMGRNKLIYALAEFAIVVSSDFQTGGTWAGALEAFKGGWCSVFVRAGENVPKGNRELMKLGAVPFAEAELDNTEDLLTWLRKMSPPQSTELDLFG
jgi:predicted Rossmann fold nucleotide-binding protein DprA/Smf involved in DNA uptake